MHIIVHEYMDAPKLLQTSLDLMLVNTDKSNS